MRQHLFEVENQTQRGKIMVFDFVGLWLGLRRKQRQSPPPISVLRWSDNAILWTVMTLQNAVIMMQKRQLFDIENSVTVEPLTNDHPHQRPSLSYDHISCDGQWFLFVYESLTSDHPSYTTKPMWFWGWSYKRGSTVFVNWKWRSHFAKRRYHNAITHAWLRRWCRS